MWLFHACLHPLALRHGHVHVFLNKVDCRCPSLLLLPGERSILGSVSQVVVLVQQIAAHGPRTLASYTEKASGYDRLFEPTGLRRNVAPQLLSKRAALAHALLRDFERRGQL